MLYEKETKELGKIMCVLVSTTSCKPSIGTETRKAMIVRREGAIHSHLTTYRYSIQSYKSPINIKFWLYIMIKYVNLMNFIKKLLRHVDKEHQVT